MKNILIIVAAVLLLSSCKSKSLFQRMNESRQEAIGWCNLNVPINVRQGQTIVRVETDTIQGDTVRVNVPCPDGTIAVADCPPARTIYRTRTEFRTDTIPDTRQAENERILRLGAEEKLAAAMGKNESLTADLSSEKKTVRSQWYWIIGLSITLVAAGAFTVYRVFKF